jgi:hypothetical protein
VTSSEYPLLYVFLFSLDVFCCKTVPRVEFSLAWRTSVKSLGVITTHHQAHVVAFPFCSLHACFLKKSMGIKAELHLEQVFGAQLVPITISLNVWLVAAYRLTM